MEDKQILATLLVLVASIFGAAMLWRFYGAGPAFAAPGVAFVVAFMTSIELPNLLRFAWMIVTVQALVMLAIAVLP